MAKGNFLTELPVQGKEDSSYFLVDTDTPWAQICAVSLGVTLGFFFIYVQKFEKVLWLLLAPAIASLFCCLFIDRILECEKWYTITSYAYMKTNEFLSLYYWLLLLLTMLLISFRHVRDPNYRFSLTGESTEPEPNM